MDLARSSTSRAAQPPASPGRAPLKVVGGNRRGPLRPQELVAARKRLSSPMLAQGIRLSDAAVAACVLALGLLSPLGPVATAGVGGVMVVGDLLVLGALRVCGAYAHDGTRRPTAGMIRTAGVAALAAAPVLIVVGMFAPAQGGRVAIWLAATATALALSHLAASALVGRWRTEGRLVPNIVVVGATSGAERLIKGALARHDVAVLGLFDDRSGRIPETIYGVPVLGGLDALLVHPLLPCVDRIVVAIAPGRRARVGELLQRLRPLPNALSLLLEDGVDVEENALLDRLAGASLLRMSNGPDDRRALAKRLQDLAIGGLAALVAAPVMAVVALLVRLDSPGPVFFSQRRHGFNGETITVWKFRSMRAELADPIAARQVLKDDARVTRVGRFIRKTSLDELPQLWNVLKGEMSLVGPRPHAIGMKTAGEDTERLVAEYAWRNRMKPGLTGWAQINGSRGPVSTPEDVRRRVELDIAYIERQSFWLDLYILLITVPCLLGDREAVR